MPKTREKELLKPLVQELNKVLTPILNVEVPTLAAEAAKSPDTPKYDAILVDEGQDFLPLWWSALRNSRKPDAEMLLVADTTQDIVVREERPALMWPGVIAGRNLPRTAV